MPRLKFGGGSATKSASVKAAKQSLKEFLQVLDDVPSTIMAEEAATLKQEIRTETPYKTGALEANVYVRVIKLGRRRHTLSAGANARNAKTGYNYALIQHDSLNFKHPIKGKANYVSDPFERATARLQQRLEQAIDSAAPR